MLYWGSGGSPAASLKGCQERFHACLHACRPVWTRARSDPEPAAGSDEALGGSWTGENGLHCPASNTS
eukprot:2183227-Pyramimonas_sp.AAC.1